MPPSVSRSSTFSITLSQFCFTYFYMKTWICPNLTVFNTTSNLCVSCPISDCSSCFNLTSCAVCDTGYAVDTATGSCQTCNLTNCISCSNLTTCSQCNETAQYFYNQTDGQCYPCSIPGCTNCSNLSSCSDCDAYSNYILNPAGQCELCPNNSYANYTSNIC